MLSSFLKTLWESLEKLMLEMLSIFLQVWKVMKGERLFILIWFCFGIVYLKWLLDPMTIKPLQCSWSNIISDRIFLERWGMMCSLTAAKHLLEQGAGMLCAGGCGRAAAGSERSVLQRGTNWAAVHDTVTQGSAMAPVLTATAACTTCSLGNAGLVLPLHLFQCLCVFLRGIISVW